eukprot:TRINITY_DN4615_c0_g1_i1.p1 TRINITY_DN4615_c0_g1~~TRINITY_DN4615_c0_g1_i1.p1  ORF type:complete len:771 (+),score=181.60 TRINITY_DN4615_c0_g1_i1:171-2315(+)
MVGLTILMWWGFGLLSSLNNTVSIYSPDLTKVPNKISAYGSSNIDVGTYNSQSKTGFFGNTSKILAVDQTEIVIETADSYKKNVAEVTGYGVNVTKLDTDKVNYQVAGKTFIDIVQYLKQLAYLKLNIQHIPKGRLGKIPQNIDIRQYIAPMLGFIIVQAFGMQVQLFVVGLVREKPVRKHCTISGLSSFSYWMGVFIIDNLYMLVSILVVFVLGTVATFFEGFELPMFANINPIAHLIVLIISCSFYTLISCAFSQIFDDEKTALTVTSMVSSMITMVPFMFYYILSMLLSPDAVQTVENIVNCFPIVGLLTLYTTSTKQYLSFSDVFIKHWNAIVPLLFWDVVCFVFTLFLDSLINRPLKAMFLDDDNRGLIRNYPVFPSVHEETHSVYENSGNNQYVVRTFDLHREFKDVCAVNKLTIGLQKGEVLSIIGPNGSGKSTLINMLTGKLAPTTGSFEVLGVDSERLREVSHMIGLCPQENIFFKDLTMREHLNFFCLIRGFDGEEKKQEIEKLINQFDIGKFIDQKAGELSGAQKRRVMLTCAVIGSPPILFLDEPSSGFDPSSRRRMWNLISSLRKNCSIVLTTHSMQEATALASRVAIFVNGQLRTIGTTQKLLTDHGEGYRLSIHCEPSSIQAILNKIAHDLNIPENHFKINANLLEVNLTRQFTDLAFIFDYFIRHKEDLRIVDWTISQSTLEDVFLKFAADQRSDENM